MIAALVGSVTEHSAAAAAPQDTKVIYCNLFLLRVNEVLYSGESEHIPCEVLDMAGTTCGNYQVQPCTREEKLAKYKVFTTLPPTSAPEVRRGPELDDLTIFVTMLDNSITLAISMIP